jgi:hypothetical protein
MARYNTLLLDQTAWDVVLDSAGNIAMAQPPYAVSQDVASALKLFQGEGYYNTERGVPYFEQILGQLPPAAIIASLLEDEAKTVPGVVEAQLTLVDLTNREVEAQLLFVDEEGEKNGVIL